MGWFTVFSGPAWNVILPVMALVILLISAGSLLVGYALRQRSAPVREVAYRVGLCLVAAWPFLALAASLAWPTNAAVTASAPELPSFPIVENLSLPLLGNSIPSVDEQVIGSLSAPVLDLKQPDEQITSQVSTPIPSQDPIVPPLDIPVVTTPASLPITTPEPEPFRLPAAQLATATVITTPIGSPSPVLSAPAMAPTPAMSPEVSSWWSSEFPGHLAMALRGLVSIWIAGSLVAGFVLLRDLLRVRRFRRELQLCQDELISATLTEAIRLTGLQRRPEVYLSHSIGSPCTSGVRQPILILPQSMLDDSETRSDMAMHLGVLTHECAHVARRDVAWSLMARVVQAVYWWDPWLRRVVRHLSHLREEICDNHVLSSSVDVRLYAKALVDFAAAPLFRPLVGVIGMVANDNPLSGRVERLLEEPIDKTTHLNWRSRRGKAFMVLVACGVIGVVGVGAKVSTALAQVLLPAFQESERTSVESLSRMAPSSYPSEAAVDSSSFSAPPETGSGVRNSVPHFQDFSAPSEAGSGVAMPGTFSDEVSRDEALIDAPIAVRPDRGHKQPSPVNAQLRQQIEQQIQQQRQLQLEQETFGDSSRRDPGFNTEPEAALEEPEQEELVSEELKEPTSSSAQPISTLTLNLNEGLPLPHHTRIVVLATLPDSEGVLPKRIRFEGLVVTSSNTVSVNDDIEPEPPLLSPPVADSPPAPAEPPVAVPESEVGSGVAVTAEPPVTAPAEEAKLALPAEPAAPVPAADTVTPQSKLSITVSGPTFAINALTHLQTKGAVLTVAQDNSPPAEQAAAAPVYDSNVMPVHTYRMSIEAIADEAGQYKGLCCWGRELPHANPGQLLPELTQMLTRWKEECGFQKGIALQAVPRNLPYTATIQTSSGPANVMKTRVFSIPGMTPTSLIVTLRVFDSMRYVDVQSIVKACESLQIQVEIVSGTAAAPVATRPIVYTATELTLLYDKKGQRVGEHPVLLAEKAGTTGTQVITDGSIDGYLNGFAYRDVAVVPTLLLKADPDLSFEMLQTFMVRANRMGIRDVILLPREELQIRQHDRLIPLVDEAVYAAPSLRISPPTPTNTELPPTDGDFKSSQSETELDPVQPSDPFEKLPRMSNLPGRVRGLPSPIPSESVVLEH